MLIIIAIINISILTLNLLINRPYFTSIRFTLSTLNLSLSNFLALVAISC
jgi:hypothetical protein